MRPGLGEAGARPQAPVERLTAKDFAIEPSNLSGIAAVYGAPPAALASVPAEAVQVSPVFPGATPLEGVGALSSLVMLAPAGTVERRYGLALGLTALVPGGSLIALAPKDRGGSRLKKELQGFGCSVEESIKAHHRICAVVRPEALTGVDAAVAAGAARVIEPFGLVSQPGVFSWDRIDPGSALLAAALPAFNGKGADLGCGIGYLSRAVLTSPRVERLAMIDIDRRAIDAARRNVDDPRADFHWADVTGAEAPLTSLDFVVMNPPFHDGGFEDKALGQAFIKRAAAALRKGGSLWLVANRHLPYETTLTGLFATVEVKIEQGGYKVFEARR